jgi:hypothetical protein
MVTGQICGSRLLVVSATNSQQQHQAVHMRTALAAEVSISRKDSTNPEFPPRNLCFAHRTLSRPSNATALPPPPPPSPHGILPLAPMLCQSGRSVVTKSCLYHFRPQSEVGESPSRTESQTQSPVVACMRAVLVRPRLPVISVQTKHS